MDEALEQRGCSQTDLASKVERRVFPLGSNPRWPDGNGHGVGWKFTSWLYRSTVIRLGTVALNADGTPDATFGRAGTAPGISLGQRSYPDNVLVQRDGRILVTGECDNGLAIARFHEE